MGIAKRLEFSEFTHIEREKNGSDPLAAESFPRAPGMAVPVSVSRRGSRGPSQKSADSIWRAWGDMLSQMVYSLTPRPTGVVWGCHSLRPLRQLAAHKISQSRVG